MQKDPVVAAAYSTSLRSTVVPRLHSDGSFSSQVQHYVDSLTLIDQLRAITHSGFNLVSKSIEENDIVRGVEIPAFLFSTGDLNPVLVDKYFQARAVNGIVVSSQSGNLEMETDFVYEKRHLTQSPRNPTKALLSALLEAITGIVPHHIGVSISQNKVKLGYPSFNVEIREDWRWSTGSSPYSMTSRFSFVNKVMRDISARHILVHALDECLSLVNQRRSKRKPQDQVSRDIENGNEDEMKGIYEIIDKIVGESRLRKWKDAIFLLPDLFRFCER